LLAIVLNSIIGVAALILAIVPYFRKRGQPDRKLTNKVKGKEKN
jgi:hypothetical protein